MVSIGLDLRVVGDSKLGNAGLIDDFEDRHVPASVSPLSAFSALVPAVGAARGLKPLLLSASRWILDCSVFSTHPTPLSFPLPCIPLLGFVSDGNHSIDRRIKMGAGRSRREVVHKSERH
jgi:hypothetical protein